jgi:hypothetical protein
MLIDTDPGTFVLLLFIGAVLFGPFLYGSSYLIAYVCLWRQRPSNADNLQLGELQPHTHVGHPDGLCYLPLFKNRYHSRVIRQIGHFPSIIALARVSKSYRVNARGVLTVIGDGVAHFEPNRREGLVWDVIEAMMARFDLVGGQHLTRASFSPPDGYGYIELFIPTKRNEILEVLGPNPLLQTIINVNPAYRFSAKGALLEKEAGHLWFETGHLIDGWMQVLAWNACHPGVRCG